MIWRDTTTPPYQHLIQHYPVVLLGMLAGTLATERRFSLRTMLIATTLVAVVLGLVVAMR